MTMRLRAIACAMIMMCALAPVSANAAEKSFGWQCVTFARQFSGIQLFGNAWTWWNQATGRYDQGKKPAVGAVLVFKSIANMRAGHVATVSEIVSDRVVKITHANWSIINGHRGQVERDVKVVDTSPNNDWSQVKVWYAPIAAVGQRAYPTYGFIYKSAAAALKGGTQIASAE